MALAFGVRLAGEVGARRARPGPSAAVVELADLFTFGHIILTPGATMPTMPTKQRARPKLPPVVAAVVRPISARLSRMEAMLVEMRAQQDVKVKKINKLQQQFDDLMETLRRRIRSHVRRRDPQKRRTGRVATPGVPSAERRPVLPH